jgi:hypothetical protein
MSHGAGPSWYPLAWYVEALHVGDLPTIAALALRGD